MQNNTQKMEEQVGSVTNQKLVCYHCGESCRTGSIIVEDKNFCCEGCKLVYSLLNENNLCTYYSLNTTPGISPFTQTSHTRYSYLNDEKVLRKLVRFTDTTTTYVTFFVPGIHCSSCIWLLENLHRLSNGVVSSSVNFLRKEATVVYKHNEIKLSQIVDLMAGIGYEPLINLNDLEKGTEKKTNRNEIIKIGIAGFCFGNIMMLSFPEYFAAGNFYELHGLSTFFSYLNLFLALPVFFYCASGFFMSAWKSITNRYLNIDAPIALAIVVTFGRSLFEIISESGAGYLDSMSGIVFFMLIGRYFQNRTYDTLSFERDYKSFFPLGVTVKKDNEEISVSVSDLNKSDRIIIRSNELVPADAILISPQTHIDFSFITGESAPVKKMAGELIFAGGKQLEGAVEMEVVNLTSQSYLTQLWNKDHDSTSATPSKSYVDTINRYFTLFVLCISFASGFYWYNTGIHKALDAFTAVLIVACPCGLLLTSTFANGNILRILGRSKFYLKNAEVISNLVDADLILFDKTGTITRGSDVCFVGDPLNEHELKLVCSLAAQSSHPLSRQLYTKFNSGDLYCVYNFEENPGKGIRASIDGEMVVLGSADFLNIPGKGNPETSQVFCSVSGICKGYFRFTNSYRPGMGELMKTLKKDYGVILISGDNESELKSIENIFGRDASIYFNQKPEDKMQMVDMLRRKGFKVIMIGDGLNDAGALNQSNLGIAVSDDTNNFSPACDAILDGSSLILLPQFIKLAKAGKMAIIFTFIISLTYNIIGLSFAVQGMLSPVVAAILMPLSSVTIVMLAVGSTSLFAKWNKLWKNSSYESGNQT